MTVFYADDDAEDCELFRDALSQVDDEIKTVIARDGREALAYLENTRELPDYIFLDINMPLKNGFECLTEIRGDVQLKETPVIIYSTSDDTKLIDWMYNAGANLYLCKPTDFKRLKSRILKAISIDWQKQTPFSQPGDFVLG